MLLSTSIVEFMPILNSNYRDNLHALSLTFFPSLAPIWISTIQRGKGESWDTSKYKKEVFKDIDTWNFSTECLVPTFNNETQVKEMPYIHSLLTVCSHQLLLFISRQLHMTRAKGKFQPGRHGNSNTNNSGDNDSHHYKKINFQIEKTESSTKKRRNYQFY